MARHVTRRPIETNGRAQLAGVKANRKGRCPVFMSINTSGVVMVEPSNVVGIMGPSQGRQQCRPFARVAGRRASRSRPGYRASCASTPFTRATATAPRACTVGVEADHGEREQAEQAVEAFGRSPRVRLGEVADVPPVEHHGYNAVSTNLLNPIYSGVSPSTTRYARSSRRTCAAQRDRPPGDGPRPARPRS